MSNTCTPYICHQLVELMKMGLTQKEVCPELGISEKVFYNWKDSRHPAFERDFAEAYAEAKLHQFSWWARHGRGNLGEGREFNTTLYSLFMANMFGWRSSASKEDEAMAEIRKVKEQLGIEDEI